MGSPSGEKDSGSTRIDIDEGSRIDASSEALPAVAGDNEPQTLKEFPSAPYRGDELIEVVESSSLGLLPDNSVGNYRLVELLGEGSYAEVWLAVEEREHGFAKRVALKLMKAGPTASQEELKAMRAEARLCAMLHHPRLVDVYAAGDVEGLTFIAMEFVDGKTLHQFLFELRNRGLRLPLSVLLDIAIQICEGLDYAHNATDHDGHRLELVHRDLKPGNIMLSRQGQVKVADFGLAKTNTSETDTKEGMLRGTPGFVAPEIWKGSREFLPSVDLFALGVMLFEMATGQTLFTGNIHAVIFRVVSGDIEEDLQQLRLHRPELAGVLRGLLQREPADRTPSAWKVLEELKELRRGVSSPGDLKLFMELFFVAPQELGAVVRTRTLPPTDDPDWNALFGGTPSVTRPELAAPEVPLNGIPPTRTMSAPARTHPDVSKPSPSQTSTLSRFRIPLAAGAFVGILLGLFIVWASPPSGGEEQVVPASPPTGPFLEETAVVVESQSEPAAAVEPSETDPRSPPLPVDSSRRRAESESPKRPVAAEERLPSRSTGRDPIAVSTSVRKPVAQASPKSTTEKPVEKKPSRALGDTPGAQEGAAIQEESPPRTSSPGASEGGAVSQKGCLVLRSSPPGASVAINKKPSGLVAGSGRRIHRRAAGTMEIGMGLDAEILAQVRVELRPDERVEVSCSLIGAPACKTRVLSGGCSD